MRGQDAQSNNARASTSSSARAEPYRDARPADPRLRNASGSGSGGGTRRCKDMWFADGNVTLQAGRTLFRVHKSILAAESGLFATMFSLPQGPDTDADGTDAHPLVVPDVPEGVLTNLLRVLYPKWGAEPDFTQRDLTDLLQAAQRLQCDGIRARTVSLLDARVRQPVDKIALARDYGISDEDWVWPAFRKLAESMVALSPDDLRRVGPELALKLLRAQLHLARVRSLRFAKALAKRPSGAVPCAHVVAFAQATLSGPIKEFGASIAQAFNERRPKKAGGEAAAQENCCSLQVLDQMQWGQIVRWDADEAALRDIFESKDG